MRLSKEIIEAIRYQTICTCFKNAIKAIFALLRSSLVQNIVLKLYTFICNTQYFYNIDNLNFKDNTENEIYQCKMERLT